MSHTIYSTDALVLRRVATGEADVTYWLLTEELGLIVARAQSARKELSKMRGYLQLYTPLKVSLVRGKYVWRITGAEQCGGKRVSLVTMQQALRNESLSAFARVADFTRRMVLSDTHGTQDLFEIVQSARQDLLSQDAHVQEIELYTVGRLLVSLGYLDETVLSRVQDKKITQNEFAQAVNRAILESHL